MKRLIHCDDHGYRVENFTEKVVQKAFAIIETQLKYKGYDIEDVFNNTLKKVIRQALLKY